MLLFSTGPVMVASADASGPVLSFWRLWIGAALMGGLTLVQVRSTGRRPDRVGWIWAGRCGVAFGIHQLFFMIAIKETSVVDVTLMQVLQPVLVGVLAVILFGERPGRAFLGVVAAAGVIVGLYVFVAGEAVGGIGRADLLRALYIAAIPGALGHFVTTWPLRQVAANIPPVMQLAMPFLAGGLAWVLLGQRVTWLHVLGGAITIAGVVGSLSSASGRRLVAPGPDPAIVPGD